MIMDGNYDNLENGISVSSSDVVGIRPATNATQHQKAKDPLLTDVRLICLEFLRKSTAIKKHS